MSPPRRLLLVDDDRLVLSTIAAGLRGAGYEVAEAGSFDAAIELLTRFAPELALLDIRMGEDSGFDLARELQARGEVPFLFLSAYGDEATVEEAAALGAVGFLVKPVDIPHLVPSIEAAFARASDLRRLRSTGRQLEAALDQQREISVAIGILMERHRLTRDEALARIRDSARASRRKLSDVSAAIAQACDQLAISRFERRS